MAVANRRIDAAAYGRLLTEALPRQIQTKREHEQALAELERLDTLGRSLTREEDQFAALMGVLVRDYEERRYPLGANTPAESLRSLMEFRELRQRDLVPIFGSRSVTSAVLSGKRSISKAHARRLSEQFHVPVSLFV